MSKRKDVFHIISNTHWDREWRYTFQRNRQKLVEMMDNVLNILEQNPDYRAFHLDSQSVILKDYLEIKPHNKERIIHLTLQGRLLHGPWYVLPDQFLVGGETLIRNLLLGHKTSEQFGGVTKTGYSPFSWGQISQLPQIYKQFNIELIMFYRGVNSLDSPKAEFIWRGADGTEMLTSRFSTMPRYNFYFYIYRPVAFNQGISQVENTWGEGGAGFHFADKELYEEDYFIPKPIPQYFPENIEKQVKAIITDQAGDFQSRHKIWMEGHDSSGPNAITTKIIQDIRRQFPDIEVKHSTLTEYAQNLKEELNIKELKTVEGERRSAQNDKRCTNLYGFVTSARMYLKQKHFEAEKWIQYHAEPMNVLSGIYGCDIRDQYPEKAWELIIQNSAHDSIGGCSLDAIHEDMMVRYQHSLEISQGVFERASKYLVSRLNTGIFNPKGEEGIFLTAINTIQFERSEVIKACIDIPVSLDKGSLKVVDENGMEQDLSILDRKPFKPMLEQLINRPMYYEMIRYEVLLHLQTLPSFGLKLFQVMPAIADKDSSLSRLERTISNDFLSITAEKDGTLTIADKTSGKTYENAGYFVDEGEAGHAWVHEKVDPVLSTLGKTAEISAKQHGNLQQELHIHHKLFLPKDLKSRREKKTEMRENNIHLTVILKKDSRIAEMEIEVHNQSESHRLRMMFPTGLQAKYAYAEGPFDVVERSLERPDTSSWIEQPMYDYPMHHFVDVSDGENGAALLIEGLKEYEVLPDPENTIAITLFRTFEYVINPASQQDFSHQKGSQMLGKVTCKLAFYPHQGDWNKGGVYRNAFLYNYPLHLVQTGTLQGDFGSRISMLSVTPEDIMVSSIKKAEKGIEEYVIRVFNPTQETRKGTIRFQKPIREAFLATLEEIQQARVKLQNNNTIPVELEAKKIQTYLIRF